MVGGALSSQMMAMQNQNISYQRYRFPPHIIAPQVWLYTRFNLACLTLKS
jgi:transposase-like protein